MASEALTPELSARIDPLEAMTAALEGAARE